MTKTRMASIVAGLVTLVGLIVIIWLDLTSQFWQEAVILSGIAAGLLTFLLTALFLDDAVARREHRKWYPVTRLALTDLLHTIADDDKSDIRRGQIVPRSLPDIVSPSREDLDVLLASVVSERDEITVVLARWAQFLASSADVQDLMIHLADLAESLDDIRDEVVAIETRVDDVVTLGLPGGGEVNVEELSKLTRGEVTRMQAEVAAYNAATTRTIDEILSIQKTLDEDS